MTMPMTRSQGQSQAEIQNQRKNKVVRPPWHVASTILLTIALPLAFLPGCTQMPTEKQGVSDLRPQISFKADAQRHTARIVIDGLDMGALGSYLDGAAALRLLSGTHQLQVVQGSQILLEEKFYAGDGVSRTFRVQ